MTQTVVQNSFLKDFLIYVGRVREFKPIDWLVYTSWIGLMFGLFAAISVFLWAGTSSGVTYPAYVWSIPFGSFVFALAIAIDTIGHRTIYLEELKKGEALIHHMTIFSGITSVVGFCLAYEHRDWVLFPTLVLAALSVIYSLFDEALHWHRYLTLKSDRVEMWSHFFIMVGHLTMISAWLFWLFQGYPGVAETVVALQLVMGS